MAGDEISLGKIRLLYGEIDDADAQAARLKCTVPDIYLANRRIAYHVEPVKKDAPDGAPAGTVRAAIAPEPDGESEADR